MKELTPEQKNKIEKMATFEKEPQLGMFGELHDINLTLEKIASKETPEQKLPEIFKVELPGVELVTIKGEQGEVGPEPKDERLVELIKPLIPKPIKGDKGDTVVGPMGPKPEVGKDYPTPKDGKDGKDGESIIGPQGLPGKDGSPDTGKQIVDKINELPLEEEYQIGVEHIKGLLKRLEKMDEKSRLNQNNPGGISGRDIIKDVDISTQLDGVTTTFNIGAVYNIISISLSSYPYGSLRKNVDYTWTGTSVTFTSTIDPATQLSLGQQCILTVISA